MTAETADTKPMERTLTWSVRLLASRPRMLPWLLATVAVAGLLATIAFGSLVLGVVAMALLLGATSEFLFPSRYKVGPAAIEAVRPGARVSLPTATIRRVRLERSSVTVTSLARPSRLDAFRGVTLRFAPDGEVGDRESVIAFLRTAAPSARWETAVGRRPARVEGDRP